MMTVAIEQFLAKHWRLVGVSLLAIGLICGSFAAGRASVPELPARVVERVEYRDRVVEKVVEVKAKDEAKAKTVVVYRDRLVKPDGTKIEHEVERSDSVQVTDTKTATVGEMDAARDLKTERVVEAQRPQWRVSALAGVTNPRLSPLSVEKTFGVMVERRVVGPVSAGVWALSGGPSLGLALSVEF